MTVLPSEELVGGQCQLLGGDIGARDGTARRSREACQDFLLPRALGGECLGCRHGSPVLGREDHCSRLPGRQVDFYNGRPKQVLDVVEPAGRLVAMPEVPVPLWLDLDAGVRAQDSIGLGPVVCDDLDAVVNGFDAERALAARLPVIVAVGAERFELQS